MTTSLQFDDDSLRSCLPMTAFDNSNASTAASVADVNDTCVSESLKSKLPSDFSFLSSQPRAKVARTTSSPYFELSDDDFDDDVDIADASTNIAASNKAKQSTRSRATPAVIAQQLKVCGPEIIQTLRGRLLGREVALIICGESHEDAIDLTREHGILEEDRAWLEAPATPASGGGFARCGFDSCKALKSKQGVTLKAAQVWSARVLQEEGQDDKDGAVLVFEGKPGTAAGSARVFPAGIKASSAHHLPPQAKVFHWCDQDMGAEDFNNRRLRGETISAQEQDAIIAERKSSRATEGLELFDDWLFRQCEASACEGPGANALCVDLVLENQVPPSDVELHIEPSIEPAPPAHACLKSIELDSDADSDSDEDKDDGTGSFADYLLRRAKAHLPADRVHCVDPRDLGNPESDAENTLLQALLPGPLEQDREEAELMACDAKMAVNSKMKKVSQKKKGGKIGFRCGHIPGKAPAPLPSWEAYFGTVASLLYYNPHVKVDFVPMLVKCDLCSTQRLAEFFETLYFGTVPDAVSLLGPLDDEMRSLTRSRSLAYVPTADGSSMRRPTDNGLVSVKAAPIDCYLKARGSQPPRTWVSGLADQVRAAGLGDLVDTAQAWMRECVLKLLADPKQADATGDYLMAFLRECHRDVYDDIDRSDATKIRKAKFMKSEKHPNSKKHRHNLAEISIPHVEKAFAELRQFDIQSSCASTRRQRLLAKIAIDAFQLRLVDVASILKMAQVVTKEPEGSRVVVVFYAGADHTTNVATFWEKYGFSANGLPARGLVGKTNFKDGESRGLKLPAYLHDFQRLFPVPPA